MAIIAEFSREALAVTLNLIAINIPAKLCTNYMKTLKKYLFDRPRMKRVYDDPDDNERRLLIFGDKVSDLDLSSLPEELKEFIRSNGGVPVRHVLRIGYDQLQVDEVLKKLLPPELSEVQTAYEQAGHLAHMNLRDDVLPYKKIIGQVILDKNPILRTVVNKTGNIETEFRTFPMEVIAGEPDFDVTVKEGGCVFSFNFKDVYWNSRLSTEHHRLVEFIQEVEFPGHTKAEPVRESTKKRSAANNEKKQGSKKIRGELGESILTSTRIPIIADMMGGVGPFAIPLAKLNLFHVHCNDLNPESYKYLVKNSQLNHCRLIESIGSDNDNAPAPLPTSDTPLAGLSCYNLDGREFIRRLRRRGVAPDHVIMNLPQTAPEFLDTFIGYSRLPESHTATTTATTTTNEECRLPVIHVYAFSTAVDNLPTSALADLAARCSSFMRCSPEELGSLHVITGTGQGSKSSKASLETAVSEEGGPSFQNKCWGHLVRDVAPTKVMVCLSFRLPRSVAESVIS